MANEVPSVKCPHCGQGIRLDLAQLMKFREELNSQDTDALLAYFMSQPKQGILGQTIQGLVGRK